MKYYKFSSQFGVSTKTRKQAQARESIDQQNPSEEGGDQMAGKGELRTAQPGRQ